MNINLIKLFHPLQGFSIIWSLKIPLHQIIEDFSEKYPGSIFEFFAKSHLGKGSFLSFGLNGSTCDNIGGAKFREDAVSFSLKYNEHKS